MSPGRPVTFVVTEAFLDHFGLASTRDLPGLAELRAAGLLDARGLGVAAAEEDAQEAGVQTVPEEDMFPGGADTARERPE